MKIRSGNSSLKGALKIDPGALGLPINYSGGFIIKCELDVSIAPKTEKKHFRRPWSCSGRRPERPRWNRDKDVLSFQLASPKNLVLINTKEVGRKTSILKGNPLLFKK